LDKYFFGDDNRAHFTNIEDNELLTVATLLDPRFKTTVSKILTLIGFILSKTDYFSEVFG